MAYIPDEAIDSMNELSPGAWRLYCYLCRCRNQKTGRAFPSATITAEAIDVHGKNVFKLRSELAAKKWATFQQNEATLLRGFESSKNATTEKEGEELSEDGSENATLSSKNATLQGESSKNATQESQKRYSVVAKTLPNGSKNATPYKEEPAKEPANLTKQASWRVMDESEPPFASDPEEETLSAAEEQRRYLKVVKQSTKPTSDGIQFSQIVDYVRAMNRDYSDESVFRVARKIRDDPRAHDEVRAWLQIKTESPAKLGPIELPPGLNKQQRREFLLAKATKR